MARRLITPGGKQARIEGIEELAANIATILNRTTGQEAKKVFMTGALILKDAIIELCPVGNPAVDPHSGLLKSAVFASYGDKGKSDVLVGVSSKKAPHAHMVEYGTSNMAARPYFRPAVRGERNYTISVIADGLRKLIVGDYA